MKVVGRRREPANGLSTSTAPSIKDARAWQKAFGSLPIPKGVYRFHTPEESDEWLWRIVTRGRRQLDVLAEAEQSKKK